MAVSRIIDNFIKFPSDNAEKFDIVQKYYQLSKFPNVLWCIDCTHIAVRSTSKDEILFVNRKCFQSINVQGVCDADLKLTSIVATWPSWLVWEKIAHSCVYINATLCTLILSNILTQYIRMTYLRHRLVRFMLRYKTYLVST